MGICKLCAGILKPLCESIDRHRMFLARATHFVGKAVQINISA